MLVIGLTGPSGAGKGEVARLFCAHGIPVIDADEVYHRLLVPPSLCLNDLTARFGREILNADGTLCRPRLGSIVFSDPKSLSDLNAITHRYVMEKIRESLEAHRRDGARATVIDAPQLFEAGADALCDKIVSVLADRETRVSRIMARDGIDRDRAEKRIDAQKDDAFFCERSDRVIKNDGARELLAPVVCRMLSEWEVISP
ncbi:MAG: dephospho-CoA kinase [Clostridia bacterium]|nr:dephospho-CoA kinase [Clostridia bacterium]